MDLVRPGRGDMRSTGLVDQIHPGHPDPPKIISRYDLVDQKIRLLNASAKSSEKISDMLKKDFVHLGLDKKESKEL